MKMEKNGDILSQHSEQNEMQLRIITEDKETTHRTKILKTNNK